MKTEPPKSFAGNRPATSFVAAARAEIGLGGSAALTRLLGSALFGVNPTDPASFTVVAVVLITTALVASVVPALRATRVDPIRALRCD